MHVSECHFRVGLKMKTETVFIREQISRSDHLTLKISKPILDHSKNHEILTKHFSRCLEQIETESSS